MQRGIFVVGLREEIVDSVEQVIVVFECGEGQGLYYFIIQFFVVVLSL